MSTTTSRPTPSNVTRLAPALLLVWLLSVSCLQAQDINWYPDIASAQKAAQEENKLIFLHFTASWCRPCQTLDTFVFTNQSVQRTFAQNVAAVKIDVDQNTHLVEEYGVSSVPYDVAVTPAGRVVSKRKSPRDASAYQKMVGDFSSIIADLANGESPAMAQSLAELDELMQNKQPKFEGQPTSFTPEAPSYQRPQPSPAAAELDRKRRVTNPYIQQPTQPAPQRVANAFQPQELNAPTDNFGPAPSQSQSNNFTPNNSYVPPNNFTPKSFVPENFAPQAVAPNHFKPAVDATQSVDGNLNSQASSYPPQQQIQVNPYASRAQPVAPRNTALQRLEQSDVAAKLIREKAQQKLDAFKAEPKVVMNDKFFGAPTPKQTENNSVAGNYQAKINLPKPANGFLPPEPPSFADVDARIVFNSEPESTPDAANENQNGFQRPRTKAMNASSSKVVSKSDANDPIARGLEMASQQTATPQYALHGKCPVTLLKDSKWIDGNPKIGCVHRNRIYIFASEENLKTFQSDPDAHSPILAGYDPVVFQETGRLVDGLETHGVFMGKPPQQRIVLFATAETRARFQSQPKKYLEAVRQAMKSTGASSQLLR